MSEFVLHPDAVKDLEEIWEYIAADNPDAADRIREEIYAIQSLVPFPYVGHGRPDLTNRSLRFQIVRNYVIAYAADEKPLAVIAVLHGRRNPRVIAAILRKRT
ncbi:MAG TPA: type II toxin-antitoxin system RelE/ParE family toxin [Candidatus Sulfotelmatobacter sp.]|nr:type II toxin-antitoxin system RelE/ParE family toxin [Candidatus Sulfotelmatobacter sp.]